MKKEPLSVATYDGQDLKPGEGHREPWEKPALHALHAKLAEMNPSVGTDDLSTS